QPWQQVVDRNDREDRRHQRHGRLLGEFLGQHRGNTTHRKRPKLEVLGGARTGLKLTSTETSRKWAPLLLIPRSKVRILHGPIFLGSPPTPPVAPQSAAATEAPCAGAQDRVRNSSSKT